MAIITATTVRNKLGGVTPYLDQIDDADDMLAAAITAAQARFERELQICLEPTVVKMRPASTLELGEDYDVEEAPLDYLVGSIDRRTLPRWTLRRRPVLSIEGIRLAFNETTHVLTIPSGWWQVNKQMGVVSILPIGTAVIAEGSGLWFLPLLDGHRAWNVIPQFVHIDYTAGYADGANDPRLGEMRGMLARDAAAAVLEGLQGMVPNSVSIDGLSQPFEPVGQRIDRMRKSVEEFLVSWTRTNRPPKMFMV